jgi:hypothetical protein
MWFAGFCWGVAACIWGFVFAQIGQAICHRLRRRPVEFHCKCRDLGNPPCEYGDEQARHCADLYLVRDKPNHCADCVCCVRTFP